MFSGIDDFHNESVIIYKSKFQQCIPILVTVLLGTELISIIALMVLYDNSDSNENLLYISTASYIMLSTIFFLWHSIFNEDAFELMAFCIMTTILSILSIQFSETYFSEKALRIICLFGFLGVQIFYYVISIYLYRHYHKNMLHELNEGIAKQKLLAIRTFQMFISMLRLDFMLYVILLVGYLYYASSCWSSFSAIGLVLGVFGSIALVSHTIIGVFAVTKEHVRVIIFYFFSMIIDMMIKIFILYVLTVQPGDSISRLLMVQAVIVFVGDLIVIASIFYLGWWTYKSFGIGTMSAIRKAKGEEIKLSFI